MNLPLNDTVILEWHTYDIFNYDLKGGEGGGERLKKNKWRMTRDHGYIMMEGEKVKSTIFHLNFFLIQDSEISRTRHIYADLLFET